MEASGLFLEAFLPAKDVRCAGYCVNAKAFGTSQDIFRGKAAGTAFPLNLDEGLVRRAFQSIFSLERFAFQTMRSVVSRKKRDFSALFGPGGAVPLSHALLF
ncbi:hypothetical protein [uncultured Desulfovibrio sp.]|uniref:hypothetical protein n=1 Tax=uncultured Desulfovibrio sp. TaxID=167968 RepID=UPI001C3971AB|nr:hypothetical protein [uncultured Desulfovibrio sp.]HIX41527.1 hypothetical protein [Candidatus Desulfovibrio intestinigallinarum]